MNCAEKRGLLRALPVELATNLLEIFIIKEKVPTWAGGKIIIKNLSKPNCIPPVSYDLCVGLNIIVTSHSVP